MQKSVIEYLVHTAKRLPEKVALVDEQGFTSLHLIPFFHDDLRFHALEVVRLQGVDFPYLNGALFLCGNTLKGNIKTTMQFYNLTHKTNYYSPFI